jgi:hypothetical protein
MRIMLETNWRTHRRDIERFMEQVKGMSVIEFEIME